LNSNQQSIAEFVAGRNANKFLFTAGPASLVSQNLTGLRPCFGRGDADYEEVEDAVLSHLKRMSGHKHIARLQGAASVALEIMTLNFLRGKVLVVQTGYYSERLKNMAEASARLIGAVTKVDSVGWRNLESLSGSYDWVVACYTETSCALKLDISQLSEMTASLGARLMLDATASIGLEEGHAKADVIGYSSCKGLFGMTGAAFVAFHAPPSVKVDSFYLDLETHLRKMMTGPYHAICSLADILPVHDDLREAVFINKRRFRESAGEYLVWPEPLQPQLCSYVDCTVKSSDPRAVLYKPRDLKRGSVVCHLGEAHLGSSAGGDILDILDFVKPA
jgi:aspartate aminotransferase-like enzyme